MEITVGFILSCFTMMAIQTATLLIVTILVFGVMCRGSIFLVALITIGQGLCGMTYGKFIRYNSCSYHSCFLKFTIMWSSEIVVNFL